MSTIREDEQLTKLLNNRITKVYKNEKAFLDKFVKAKHVELHELYMASESTKFVVMSDTYDFITGVVKTEKVLEWLRVLETPIKEERE